MNTAKLKIIEPEAKPNPTSGGLPGYNKKPLKAPYFEPALIKMDTPGLLKLRMEALKKKKRKPVVKKQNLFQKLLKLIS